MAAVRAVAVVVMVVLPVVAGGEALAAVVAFLQVVALDHRAHRTIDDQDAFAQRLFEQGDAIGGCSQGRVGQVIAISGLVGDQRDHLEMRRTTLAGDGLGW